MENCKNSEFPTFYYAAETNTMIKENTFVFGAVMTWQNIKQNYVIVLQSIRLDINVAVCKRVSLCCGTASNRVFCPEGRLNPVGMRSCFFKIHTRRHTHTSTAIMACPRRFRQSTEIPPTSTPRVSGGHSRGYVKTTRPGI